MIAWEGIPRWMPGDSTRVSAARLRNGVLLQVLLCTGPAMAAVRLGHPALGARLFFVLLGACLAFDLLVGSAMSPLTLVLATVPAVMLLRDLVLYNSMIVLLVVALGWLVLRSRADLHLVTRPAFAWLLGLATLYWLISYALTGLYFSNLRTLELVFTAIAVVVLARYRTHFATALFGMAISLAAIGIGLFSYGDRLGYAVVNGTVLGNPIAFGLPLALLLVLANADGGKWLLLQRNLTARVWLSVGVCLLLLLSTSRGSWLVAAVCMLLVLIFNRMNRRVALITLALSAMATAAILPTRRGADLRQWVWRTFSAQRTAGQITSGRSDQWMLLPEVMRDAPPWGFGPGSGKDVYAKYSLLDPRVRLKPGHRMQWHSLYMQLAVETGLIGLAALLVLFAVLLRSNTRAWKRRRELTPLLGTVGFLLIMLTVSGLDAASGLFLGFGLLTLAREGLASSAGAERGARHTYGLVGRESGLVHPTSMG